MKVLFDIIFKNVPTLPNLTCKGPPKYENKHWEVLKDEDCSSTVAPTVIGMADESVVPTVIGTADELVVPTVTGMADGPVSVSVRSSSDRNSTIPEDTEKLASNKDDPQTAILVSMSRWNMILSCVVIFLVISFALFIIRVLYTLRQKLNYVCTPPSDKQEAEEIPLENTIH